MTLPIPTKFREACVDWTGEQIIDGSTPRYEITCGELREAAVLIEGLVLSGMALLEASERHIFGDECKAEREAFRAILIQATGTGEGVGHG